MSGNNFIVPPRSWDDIGRMADELRSELGLEQEPLFPVMDVIEFVLDYKLNMFRLEVGDHQSMNGAEGYTDPLGTFIMLREDVYEGAWSGEGRPRFTAAHELGHFIMHTNIPLARAKPEQYIKPFRLAEPQANRFAAEILMPRRFFHGRETEQDVINRHGVSYEAASNRIHCLRAKPIR